MWFAGIGMVVNVVLSIALFPVFKHVGIALATTIAGWINTGLLIVVLRQRGHFSPDLKVVRKIGLILIASLLMGVVLHYCALGLAPWISDSLLVVRVGALAALVGVGMLAFIIFAQVSGGSDLLGHVKALTRRNT